jgi:trk system potassium uptake protein TrkA
MVLQKDALDAEFLRREGVTEAQVMVSALRPDERNLFASVLGMELGCERQISVVHNTAFESSFEFVGVDVVVNPRRQVIEEILNYLRGSNVEKLTFVEHHRGEVMEVELDRESQLVDRPIEALQTEFPEAVAFGAVTRRDEIIIPRGDTVLRPGDHLVFFTDTSVLDEVLRAV